MELPVGSAFPSADAPHAPMPEEGGTTCRSCGARNSDSARFCQQCGASLAGDASSLRPEPAPAPRVVGIATAVACEVARPTPLLGPPRPVPPPSSGALGKARAVLERYGGSVEDLPESPDTVVAVFGTDPPDGDGPLRAVRAAAELRDAFTTPEEPEPGAATSVAVRAGVGTCDVVDGDPASEERSTGRAVDLAVRLQRMASPGEVIVAEGVGRLVGDLASVEPVDPRARLDGDQPAGPLRLLSVAPEPAARRNLAETPLVGRDREHTLLRETFQRIVSERAGALVAVVGEPGVGKTRLVEEFIRELEAEDGAARVLRVRCLPEPEGGATWPLAEIVEQAAGIDGLDPPDEARRKIERLFEGEAVNEDSPAAGPDVNGSALAERIAHIVGLPGASPAPAETPWALRRLLQALARRGPLVLSVDDVDRADAGFSHLLLEIVERTRDAPVLVLFTGDRESPRTSPATDALTIVSVEPLPEAELASLVEHLLGGDPGSDVRALVMRVSEGNPFVAEQMLARLIEEDLLRFERGRFVPTTDLSTQPAPPGIEALLEARLQALELEEQAVVGLAAVVGETFPWAPMAELVPESARPAVRDHLEALVQKQLIRPERSESSGEAFGFRHSSIRDAAAGSVPAEAAAEVHERYARWLEQATGGRASRSAEVLGSHLESASRLWTALGRFDAEAYELAGRAASLLGTAADRAAELGDARGAFRLFDRASSLLPSVDLRRAQFLLREGLALSDLGEIRADAVLTEAAAAARTSGDRGVEWRAKVLSATLDARSAWDLDELERARATADKAIEAFEELEDDAGLALAWSLRGSVHRRWGYSAAFARAAERAAEHARRAGDRHGEQTALRDLAWATLHGPAVIDDAVERCEGIVERLRGDRPAEQDAAGVLALLMARRGRIEEARELTDRVADALEELGLEEEQATCLHRSGLIEILAGDLDPAEVAMRRALELAERCGSGRVRSQAAASLAHVVGERGRTEEALELSEFAERAAAREDIVAQVGWRTARAKTLARLGRLDEADALARAAVRLAEQTDSSGLRGEALLDLAEVLHLAGRTNEAMPFARRSLRTFQRRGAEVPASKARALLERLGARPDRKAPTVERHPSPDDQQPPSDDRTLPETSNGELGRTSDAEIGQAPG